MQPEAFGALAAIHESRFGEEVAGREWHGVLKIRNTGVSLGVYLPRKSDGRKPFFDRYVLGIMLRVVLGKMRVIAD